MENSIKLGVRVALVHSSGTVVVGTVDQVTANGFRARSWWGWSDRRFTDRKITWDFEAYTAALAAAHQLEVSHVAS